MLEENIAGIIIPILILFCTFFTFVMTLKSARLLKSLFQTRKFQLISAYEVQIRVRHSVKSICKRILPLYGVFSYTSIQYDIPPIGHIFQITIYLLLVWGFNFYLVFFKESISYEFCIFIGILATGISIWLCLYMHSSFIKSFNIIEKDTEIGGKIADNSTILDGKLQEINEKVEFNDNNLVISLALSLMISLGCCFLSFFHSSIAKNGILATVFIQICINFAIDLPLRITIAKFFQIIHFCKYYEKEYPPRFITIPITTISKLKFSEIDIEERNHFFPINNLSIPLDYSDNLSRKIEGNCENSSEMMINKLSENNFSDSYQETCKKHPSERSFDTFDPQHVMSEDDNIKRPMFFDNSPREISLLKSRYSTPAKYSSPEKYYQMQEEKSFYPHRFFINKESNEEGFNAFSLEKNDRLSEKNSVFNEENYEREKLLQEEDEALIIKQGNCEEGYSNEENEGERDRLINKQVFCEENIEKSKGVCSENILEEESNKVEKKLERNELGNKDIDIVKEEIDKEAKILDANNPEEEKNATILEVNDTLDKNLSEYVHLDLEKHEGINKNPLANTVISTNEEKLISYQDKDKEDNEFNFFEQFEDIQDNKPLNMSEKKNTIKKHGNSSLLKSKIIKKASKYRKKDEIPLNSIKESPEAKQESINLAFNFPKPAEKIIELQTGSPFKADLMPNIIPKDASIPKPAEKNIEFQTESPFKADLMPNTIPKDAPLPKFPKKSINLHQKLISFEEDWENPKESDFAEVVSEINARNEFDDFDFIDNAKAPQDFPIDYLNGKIKISPKNSDFPNDFDFIENVKTSPIIKSTSKDMKIIESIKTPPKTNTVLLNEANCIEKIKASSINGEFSKDIEFIEDVKISPTKQEFFNELDFNEKAKTSPIMKETFKDTNYIEKIEISPKEQDFSNDLDFIEKVKTSPIMKEQFNNANFIENVKVSPKNQDFYRDFEEEKCELLKNNKITGGIYKNADINEICIIDRQKNTSKKHKNEESDDIIKNYEEISDIRYRSQSQNDRKAEKPPSRPSKSRQKERDFLLSADFRKEGSPDKNFLKKITEIKAFIKDKSVFNKKNKKKIMKHIEKLLANKDVQIDDPDVIRLKAMLASQQSFKKKNPELPRDNSFYKNIQTILSERDTPVEENIIDCSVIKKNEERLKRISSIYSKIKLKDVSSINKHSTGSISPYNSEGSNSLL